MCPSLFLQVQIYNPAFFKYIHDRWTEHHGRYPSTGMLVLFFALHVCDEVGSWSQSRAELGEPINRKQPFPHLIYGSREVVFVSRNRVD